MLDITVGLLIIISKIIWWLIEKLHPVIIMSIIIAIPFCWLSKKEGPWTRIGKRPEKQKYRLTPQGPAIYYNKFGHLVIMEADPEMESSIRQYFREYDLTDKNFRRRS